MKKLAFLIFVFGLAYLAVLGLAHEYQRRLIYHPPDLYLTPSEMDLPQAREVGIRSPDAYTYKAWYIPPAHQSRSVVMVFHGNASAVFAKADIYRELSEQGYGVLGVGYPGYPGSEGMISQDSLVAAARVQYDWLRGQGIDESRIVFYGTSLGTGVATQLALTRRPSLLILEAPFTSMLAMAELNAPFLPVERLLKDRFLSDAALKTLDMPLMVLHGTADEVIPVEMGQTLYDGYTGGPKSLHIIPGGTHSDLWWRGGRALILDTLEKGIRFRV